MTSLQQFETNVAKSFSLAKEDIEELYQHIHFVLQQMDQLRQENAYLAQQVAQLNMQNSTKAVPKKAVKKTVRKATKKASKKVISSKTSNKVHDKTCPFAKNIKRSNMVVVGSKTEALKKGYKLCSCLTVF